MIVCCVDSLVGSSSLNLTKVKKIQSSKRSSQNEYGPFSIHFYLSYSKILNPQGSLAVKQLKQLQIHQPYKYLFLGLLLTYTYNRVIMGPG